MHFYLDECVKKKVIRKMVNGAYGSPLIRCLSK